MLLVPDWYYGPRLVIWSQTGIYWVLHDHPGYTMPVPLVYTAGACGYGDGLTLAMGLGYEPFTQQCPEVHQ